jgi:hypothetical protein
MQRTWLLVEAGAVEVAVVNMVADVSNQIAVAMGSIRCRRGRSSRGCSGSVSVDDVEVDVAVIAVARV